MTSAVIGETTQKDTLTCSASPPIIVLCLHVNVIYTGKAQTWCVSAPVSLLLSSITQSLSVTGLALQPLHRSSSTLVSRRYISRAVHFYNRIVLRLRPFWGQNRGPMFLDMLKRKKHQLNIITLYKLTRMFRDLLKEYLGILFSTECQLQQKSTFLSLMRTEVLCRATDALSILLPRWSSQGSIFCCSQVPVLSYQYKLGLSRLMRENTFFLPI